MNDIFLPTHRSFRLRLSHDWEFLTAPEGHAQFYRDDDLGAENSVIIDHLYKGIILGKCYRFMPSRFNGFGAYESVAFLGAPTHL